jgi:hypothetical protein
MMRFLACGAFGHHFARFRHSKLPQFLRQAQDIIGLYHFADSGGYRVKKRIDKYKIKFIFVT